MARPDEAGSAVSKRNESVNRLVQGTMLYNKLNANDRKVLVSLMKFAYNDGKQEGSTFIPTPLTTISRLIHTD